MSTPDQCVNLTNGASLSGFTLINGHANRGGGVGASTNAFLTNCVITGNYAQFGGGAYGGTLYNCALTGNSCWYDTGCPGGPCPLSGGDGGGAYGSSLHNCTLEGNSVLGERLHGLVHDLQRERWARRWGVSFSCYNCALTGNSAGAGGGMYNCILYNCTLTGNSAGAGGGGYGGTLNNCIVYYDTAVQGTNCDSSDLDFHGNQFA